jgi:hypothetical protein
MALIAVVAVIVVIIVASLVDAVDRYRNARGRPATPRHVDVDVVAANVKRIGLASITSRAQQQQNGGSAESLHLKSLSGIAATVRPLRAFAL